MGVIGLSPELVFLSRRELPVEAHQTWSPLHGQRRKEHERIPVLHHHRYVSYSTQIISWEKRLILTLDERFQLLHHGSTVLTSSSVSQLSPDSTLELPITLTLFRSLGHIGEVIQGMEVVKLIESRGSSSGTPASRVVIANSGAI